MESSTAGSLDLQKADQTVQHWVENSAQQKVVCLENTMADMKVAWMGACWEMRMAGSTVETKAASTVEMTAV